MVCAAPSAREIFSFSSDDEVAITVAPAAWAIWMAKLSRRGPYQSGNKRVLSNDIVEVLPKVLPTAVALRRIEREIYK